MATAVKSGTGELKKLKAEVVNLRSFVIGLAGKDLEGDYRPEFVEQMLKAAQEETTGEFKDARSFLAALE